MFIARHVAHLPRALRAMAMGALSTVARTFRQGALQHNTALRYTAAMLGNTGQPGVLLGGLSAYAIGRFAHRRVVASAGLRVT